MDDPCTHSWTEESEEVETGMGVLRSPLCKHCGAVKLEVQRIADERARRALLESLYAKLPAAAVVVPHAFRGQGELFDSADTLAS